MEIRDLKVELPNDVAEQKRLMDFYACKDSFHEMYFCDGQCWNCVFVTPNYRVTYAP